MHESSMMPRRFSSRRTSTPALLGPRQRWLSLMGCLLAGLPVSAAHAAADVPVYAANYDLALKAEGDHRAVMRVRVRDGHAIPVQFQAYKVEIAVAGRDDESVSIELRLFEKTDDGDWFSIPAKGLTFPAQLGIPVQFTWAGAGLELDLALVLSVAQP